MKAAALAAWMFVAALAVPAEAPEFHLDEPISLDLKDAKVTEVITLLGAIAHLPVVIDPAIQGSISIQLKDVPWDKALLKVSSALGFTLQVEGGKLVAAPRRSVEAPEARAVEEAGGPAASENAPRIAVELYRAAFKTFSPLFVAWTARGAERCATLTFQSGATLDAGGVLVTQFGWDPVTRTRLLAVDGPNGMRAVAIGEPPVLPGKLPLAGGVALLPGPPRNASCSDAAVPAPAPRGAEEVVALRVDEIREDGSRSVLSAPRVRARPGTSFSVRSGIPDPTGQTREVVISAYLSADGRSVVAALAASAIWKDSEGREYVYVQSTAREPGAAAPSPLPAILLGSEEAVGAVLREGAALTRPVELRIFRPEN